MTNLTSFLTKINDYNTDNLNSWLLESRTSSSTLKALTGLKLRYKIGTETDINKVIAKQREVESKFTLNLRIQRAEGGAFCVQTALSETTSLYVSSSSTIPTCLNSLSITSFLHNITMTLQEGRAA